jgi:hypothetical protein
MLAVPYPRTLPPGFRLCISIFPPPMSFVLHFFHAPQVDSVASATEYVYELCDDDPPLADRFRKFVELVTAVYPDLSDDDEDGDDERNLWPEGLKGDWGDEPVVNVGIRTDAVEEGVLSIIASKAIQAGLQMLDPQNAMLYRADHRVVEHDGRTTPFRMLTPYAAQLMQPAQGGLDPRSVRDAIGAGLRARLSGHGFELTSTDVFTIVHRERGEIRQAIGIEARLVGGEVRVALELWVSAPRIAAVWTAALPPQFAAWREKDDAARGGFAYDFIYGLTDLVESATPQEIARFRNVVPASREALDAFVAKLCSFVEDKLLPVIEPIDDLDTLAGLAFTQDALDIVRTGYVRLPEQLGTAVLARLARPALFDDVAKGLAGNPNKARYWGELDDPEAKSLEVLLNHLRTLPPA